MSTSHLIKDLRKETGSNISLFCRGLGKGRTVLVCFGFCWRWASPNESPVVVERVGRYSSKWEASYRQMMFIPRLILRRVVCTGTSEYVYNQRHIWQDLDRYFQSRYIMREEQGRNARSWSRQVFVQNCIIKGVGETHQLLDFFSWSLNFLLTLPRHHIHGILTRWEVNIRKDKGLDKLHKSEWHNQCHFWFPSYGAKDWNMPFNQQFNLIEYLISFASFQLLLGFYCL